MYNSFVFLFIGATLACSCKKQQPTFAPGQRSSFISAKIDGVSWENTPCTTCIGGGEGIVVNFHNGILGVSGQQDKLSIDFQLDNVNSVGQYFFKPNIAFTRYGDYINTAQTGPKGEAPYYYNTTDNLPGSVTITNYDLQDKIIEGTFSFDVANQFYPSLIKHITEGKFTAYYN